MAPPSDESSAGSSVKIVTIGEVRVESSRVWTHPNKCCPAAAATNGSNQNPVALLAKQLRKAAGVNRGSESTGNKKETVAAAELLKDRDGRSFLYILHYICTGDLVYPLHEGFHRFDALVKELSHFGLAEDEKNSGRSVKSPGSSQSKRRSLLKSASSSVSIHILPQMDSRTLTKCHSIHNIKSQDAVFLVDNEEQSDAKKNSRSGGNRFITAVKHYLNLKTYSSSSSVPQRSRTVQQPSSTGVFRPATPLGSTLILTTAVSGHHQPKGSVSLFGLKRVIEMLFSDWIASGSKTIIMVPLRTTSSAFIDTQLIICEDEQEPYDESGLEESSQRSHLPEVVLNRIFTERLQPAGFILTVRASWLAPPEDSYHHSPSTSYRHHQWILHKKKKMSHNIGTVGGNGVSRRPSVLQRFFQHHKSTFNINNDII